MITIEKVKGRYILKIRSLKHTVDYIMEDEDYIKLFCAVSKIICAQYNKKEK